MILYKYRSLTNLEHILDIILNQRLHCSTYLELNDPFEGVFETTIHRFYLRAVGMLGNPARVRGLAQRLGKTYKKVEDLDSNANDKIRICSLSSDLNDVRLWSYYADGHKGIVFEIDFSGLETKLHEVQYSEKLPWGILPNDKITLLGEPIKSYEVLSRKTKHWEFESEYRIIEESKHLKEGKYFDIKGRIKAIYLGTRTSDIYRKLLISIVPSGIAICTTNINKEKVIVESGECIPERKISP